MRTLIFAICFLCVTCTFFDVSNTDFCYNTFSENYNISWFYWHRYNFLDFEYCNWASWSSWTTCSLTCGNGYQQRQRQVCFYQADKTLTTCLPSKEKMAHAKISCQNSCLLDINDCSSNQCKNGGTCHNNWVSFTCTCNSRYNGTRCESDYGQCESRPCFNNGTCINLRNGFHCACSKWFTGRQCENEICSEAPRVINCPAGIQEVNFTKLTENITFTSFTNLLDIYGQSCDGEKITIHFPERESIWGPEIQELVLIANDTRGQSLPCVLQFRMNDYSHCESSPCFNNGTCINIRNGFHCECTAWFTGRHCENEICTEAPRVINCPAGIQEVNFTKLTENITFTSFTNLLDIYGQSCDREKITIHFPERESIWSPEIQELVLTANDTRGQSLPCIVQFRMNDLIPPTFVNCPSSSIEQYGSNGGAIIFWTPIVAEDNDGNVTVSSRKSSGEFMTFGTHVVQYNATDKSGNTNLCQFTVKVYEIPGGHCDSPPQLLHGIVSCQDKKPLSCGIDHCDSGYIQTNNQSYFCQEGEWSPKFSSEFATSSCFKPEPTKLERNYTFSFTCPKLKFSPLDLRDCIRQSGLCPSGDILLCDKPFQRIEGKHLSSEDLQIWTTLEGILPYEENKNGLIKRMDVHGKSIADYFTSGTFKGFCHQLKCQFEQIKAEPIREICGIGTVEYLIQGRQTCRKCGPGWYYDDGDCVQCSEGFYQDRYGQLECEKCPMGTTSVIGTFVKSKCFIKVIVEKQTAPSSINTLTLIGISISGLLLVVFVILVVLVNKWRISANKKSSDVSGRNVDPVSNPGYNETQSEVYDEIREDRVLEGYVIYKPGTTNSSGVYETLPDRQRIDNPYTRINWRHY